MSIYFYFCVPKQKNNILLLFAYHSHDKSPAVVHATCSPKIPFSLPNMASLERYVPLGKNSLSSDAPGWCSTTVGQSEQGPVCWKCKGRKQLVDKKAFKKGSKDHQFKKAKLMDQARNFLYKECSVCHGKGFLPPKRIEMSSLSFHPGMITRKRRCPESWQCKGPKAHAVFEAEEIGNDSMINGQEGETDSPLLLLHRANSMKLVQAGVTVPCRNYSEYPWYPSNKGEQLCNLVGDWRILQRVGSHRWTTDDIVTAKIAIDEISKLQETISGPLRYLDLGCGNGSVLQMTSWGLMESHDVKAFGIEARSEAAALARRSLSFNIGRDNIGDLISVIHGDFRDLERKVPFEGRKGDNNPDQLKQFYNAKEEMFHLVTGTPPYFQVDFSTSETSSEEKDDKIVTAAVINQGGMPTSVQSAPGTLC